MRTTRAIARTTVAALVLLLPLLVASPAVADASITSAGPLTTITTSDTLNCSVNHVDDTAGEFYANTACGTFIAIGGVLYGPSSIPAGGGLGSYTPYTVGGQSKSGSGTVNDPFRITTTVGLGDTGLSLTQVDSYVAGQAQFRTDVTLVNNSPTAVSGYVYRAADCYLANSDSGQGVVGSDGRVGCTNTTRAEEFVPITGGSTYYEARYSEVWQAVATQQALPNTCRCDETIDNGMALAWNVTAVGGGSQVTVSSSTNFGTGSAVGAQIPIAGSNVRPTVDAQGRNTFRVNRNSTADLTISIRPVPREGCDIISVYMTHNGIDHTMTDPDGDGVWTGSIPRSQITASDITFTVVDTCGSVTGSIGRVVLYDPSGVITAETGGQPVDGATVTLYTVPGWRPATPGDTGPQTCETVPTRGSDGWTQPAPTDIGVVAAVSSGTFSPDLNPQVTGADGRYGWDVAEGCWYVTVTADGFDPITSPVVGVPPEVTDLDLALTGGIGVAQDGVTRLSGAERIATAIAISQDTYGAGGAAAVLIARHDNYPDSLAGGPLAVRVGGPLLLTPSDGLFQTTAVEVQRVLPPGGTVHLLGGVAALSEDVAMDLMQMGYTVTRLSGPSRYATSVQIAQAVNPNPTTILVADGNTFADALIASSAAPARNATVVLTSGSTLPNEVADYLDVNNGATWITVGSAAAAALANEDQSFSGSDVYDTSQLVASAFWPSASGFAVASGENFPDALAGSAHSASRGHPLLLSPQAGMTASVIGWLTANGPFSEAVLYGGTAALSATVQSQAADAL